MSIDLFDVYWKKVETSAPMIDVANSNYGYWEDEDGWKYYGMRHRVTGERHGIVRWVMPGGFISEASYLNGQETGLKRFIGIGSGGLNVMVYEM